MSVLAAIGIGSQIAGGIFSFLGGRKEAKAAKASAAFNARFALGLGERNAASVIAQAAAEELRLRRGGDRKLSSLEAEAAARGATLTGSTLTVLADQAMEIEEEALLVRFAGEQAAVEERLNAQVIARNAGQTGQAIALSAKNRGLQSLLAGVGKATSLLIAE